MKLSDTMKNLHTILSFLGVLLVCGCASLHVWPPRERDDAPQSSSITAHEISVDVAQIQCTDILALLGLVCWKFEATSTEGQGIAVDLVEYMRNKEGKLTRKVLIRGPRFSASFAKSRREMRTVQVILFQEAKNDEYLLNLTYFGARTSEPTHLPQWVSRGSSQVFIASPPFFDGNPIVAAQSMPGRGAIGPTSRKRDYAAYLAIEFSTPAKVGD